MILESKWQNKEIRFVDYLDINKIVQLKQVCEELLLE